MKRGVMRKAADYAQSRRRKMRRYRAVAILACAVVLCTAGALIRPAVTLGSSELICTQTEHLHTETCYAAPETVLRREPACGTETLGLHVHTESCFDAEGNPVCGYADFIVHTHDASCYTESGALWCGLPEIEAHTHDEACYAPHVHTDACFAGDPAPVCGLPEHVHTDECYTETLTLVCELAETEGHAHGADCYDDEGNLVCELAETEGHVHGGDCYSAVRTLICGYPETPHVHDESCFAQLSPVCGFAEGERVPVCGREEIVLHTHTAACFDDAGLLVCGQTEVRAHVHTDACFAAFEEPVGEPVLVCGLAEHVHTTECYAGEADDPFFSDGAESGDEIPPSDEILPSDEPSGEVFPEDGGITADAVIARIDALPSEEEIEAVLAAYEDAGDDAGYERYLWETAVAARTAYAYYEELDAASQALVTNADRLWALSWLWSAATYEIRDELTVCQVNYYSQAVTTIAYGGTVGSKVGGGMLFTSWTAVIVEKNAAGQLYVDEIIPKGIDKRNYSASTSDGFVVLVFSTDVKVAVGDAVTVNFDYRTTSGYNASGYGTVRFISGGSLKPDKDNSGDLTILPGADTRDLIEVNLYDYDSSINTLYDSDHKYPGFQQDNGTKSVGSLSKYSFNFGNNITADLAAGHTSVTNQGGAINATANGANSPISGAMLGTLGADGYPALADGTSLSYLFSNSAYAKKQNTQSINGLFLYHADTGAYTFNSRENHAQFNAANDTFTLYEQILSSNFMMYPFGNFLPFNDIVKTAAQASTIDRAYLQIIAESAGFKYGQGYGDAYRTLQTALSQFITAMDAACGTGWNAADAANKYFEASGIPRRFSQNEALMQKLYSIDYDEPTDFYFGMEMKMNFVQPKDGLTGLDGQQPMVFYFTGDDDVWVYIDGVLFLDLSGIHRHVGGEIDFVRGEVRYYDLDVMTGDVATVPTKTVPFSQLVSTGLNGAGTFVNYSTHTFRFYYMERGAGSGVCRMNFNFPLLRKNTITVTKELSADGTGEILGDPDFRFQILRENGTPFVGANVTYELRDAAGNRIGTGVTGTDGVFALKAGQTAVFSGIGENAGRYFVRELLEPDAFGQYGEITVNGSSVTTGTGTTVIVGTDTFTGVDSPVKDMSDGSTAFRFDNRVTFAKLGRLELTKQLDALTDGQRRFDFAVTLDGAPLPVGKTYTVGGETRTVTEAGVVTLAPDETAVIADILAGSRFTVRETAASAEGFRVSYEGEGLTQGSDGDGSFVSGVIYTEQTVAVTVRNAERGASLELPGQKTLENPDGEAHTFSFALEQVTDSTGKTPVEGGTRETASVTMTDDEEDFTFRLAWAEGAVTPPQTFYYRITETADAAGVRYDGTVYVAEVTLAAGTDGIAAALTALWKDGEPLSLPDGQIAFVNALTGVLTVEKRVTGSAPDDEFGFTIALKRAGQPLSGTFQAEKTARDGTITEMTVPFDETGAAAIRLASGERLSLTGIPTDAAWRVEEDDPGSYRVSVSVDGGTAADGSAASGTVGQNSWVLFTNEAVYTLPETGGAGTFPFAVGGLLLAAAAVLLLRNRKKRGKEDPPSS